MKKTLCLLMTAAVLALISSCRNHEPLADDGAAAAIRLVNYADALPNGVAARVADYAREQLMVDVRLAAGEGAKISGLDAAVDWLSKRPNLGPINIVLVACPDDDGHVSIDKERGLAAINISALECEDEELFARRIERMAMRSAGGLAGLGFDPDPFCVMHSYESLEDLDRMGRNFSPPWRRKFLRAASEMGLGTEGADSAFMPNPPDRR